MVGTDRMLEGARAEVARMTDAEARQFQGRIEEARAGGSVLDVNDTDSGSATP